jgi:hypothetical protein
MNPIFGNGRQANPPSPSLRGRPMTVRPILRTAGEVVSRHFGLSTTVLIATYLAVVTLAFGLERPPWHDEAHFVGQIRDFGTNLTVHRLADYDEVAPPLVFVLYAIWGSLAGFTLPALRLFSLLIAAGTFGLLAHTALRFLHHPVSALAVVMMVMINPYTAGLSLFVYTDMTMLLCVILFLAGAERTSPVLVGSAVALGLLTRQYFLFVPLAGGAYYLLQILFARNRTSVPTLAAIGAGAVPLALLVAVWRGPAPPSGMRIWITSSSGFHLSYLILYVGLCALFLLPVVVARRNLFRFSPRAHAMILSVSLLYAVAPVRASTESVAMAGRETVGLFHRVLASMGGGTSLSDAVFYLLWLGGLHVAAFLVRDTVKKIAESRIDPMLLLNLAFVGFLVVMPFSYQVWEKYLLPLVPVLALRLIAERQTNARP